ncbi:MAG: DUF2384 domain-containing protein [Spirochaetales bacterium]|nr:DUF2384 domain-containing protein [Spirochaetales bacterium]
MLQSINTNNSCTKQLLEGIQRIMFAKVAREIAMVPEKELAEISGLSQRTISRMTDDQLLPKQSAEVIISIIRTYQRATEVFESEEVAHKWLKTPLKVLNDQSPLQAVSDRFGAELVLDLLGRIEHGVYS